MSNPITVPHLDGVFVALGNVTASRSSWRSDLRAMVDVGISFFVLRSSAVGVSFDESNVTCPLGVFDVFYPVRTAALAPCVRDQLGNADALRTILSDARALGLGVHLGLAYPDGGANHHGRTSNATRYFEQYAALNSAVAGDLWAQYGADYRGTIRGMYTDLEEANTPFYREHAADLAAGFLQPLASAVHRLDDALTVRVLI